MQQSPTISIEQESSFITQNSSENSLNKINKVDQWYRITKRMVKFFRYMKISSLRLRFIETVSYFEIEELNNYVTRKIQEDFLFLDDIKRYHEVFNTFTSFGFVWQDKEFRLAKLKANYIYDRYMSTAEAISKTNIPSDTIPIIYNRLISPRIFSSIIYLNLFNDAEKFIIEKLLMIYMRKGLDCFSVVSDKQSTAIMNRYRSITSFGHLKTINKKEKSISNIKLKTEAQYDETVLPNWTYSTGIGVVYNPIIEKHIKVIRKNTQKQSKDVDLHINSMIKIDQNTSDRAKQLHTTASRFPTRTNRSHSITKKKSLSNTLHLPSPYYSPCDRIFNKTSTLKTTFICKVHSSSSQSQLDNKAPYRMTTIPHFA